MQNEQTVDILNKMKLYGMAETLPGRLADARQAELTHAEFVGLLAADEQAHRDCRRLRRLLRRAHLKQEASLENIDYRRSRGLNKQTLLELGNTAWLDGNRNVILTGPSGVGKSYIACALGNFAARCGRPVTYVSRLEAAAGRALLFHNYSYHAVKEILAKNLDKLAPVAPPAQNVLPLHENIRGGQYYDNSDRRTNAE